MSYKQCQFHSSAIQTLCLQCLISVLYFASETPVSYTKAPNIPALHLICILLLVIQQFHTCFGDIHCFPTFTGYTPASLLPHFVNYFLPETNLCCLNIPGCVAFHSWLIGGNSQDRGISLLLTALIISSSSSTSVITLCLTVFSMLVFDLGLACLGLCMLLGVHFYSCSAMSRRQCFLVGTLQVLYSFHSSSI